MISNNETMSVQSSTVLEVRNLNVIRRKRLILKDVSCKAFPGEVMGLIGANGSGKSTLIKTILRLLPRESGSIHLNQIEVEQQDRKDFAKKVAYMAQENECRWPLTVSHIVALGRMPHQGAWQSLNKEDWAITHQVMSTVGINHLARRTITRLSGGERQRVLFARALASEPTLLLADEPTSGLDPYHQLHLMELFREQAKQGKTIVVVLHDLSLASRFCDRLLLLNKGQVLAQGTPQEVLQSDHLNQAYSITAETFQHNGSSAIIPWCCVNG